MKNFFIILIMKILNIGLKICGKHGGNFLGKIAYKWNPEIFKYFTLIICFISIVSCNKQVFINRFNLNRAFNLYEKGKNAFHGNKDRSADPRAVFFVV